MRAAVQVLLLISLVVPGLVFLWNTGDLSYYFRQPVPPGQFAYVISRLLALYALTLIWLQILLGALRPDLERGLGMRSLLRLHAALGATTLLFLVGHAALFLAGVSIRSGQFPASYLLPDFSQHYYPRQVALGAAALYMALVAGVSAALRGRRWLRGWWRRLHRLNYGVFVLGAWHGLSIGSETRLQPLQAMCTAFVVTIGAALAWRTLRSRRPGRHRSGVEAASSAGV